MADNEQTKICPLCAETIKAAAKICPHCRRPQNRRLFIPEHDAQAIGAVLMMALSALLLFWTFGDARKFSPEHHKITVIETTFGIEMTKNQTNFVASGVLTNESSFAWKLNGFQVRFLDANGKTVEVGNAGTENYNLVVQAHDDCPFRLNLVNLKKIPDYASSQTKVTDAVDPGFWFNK